MKKLYLIFLAAAVSLSVCACGKDEKDSTTTKTPATAPVTDRVTDRVTDKVTDKVTDRVTEKETSKESDTVNDGEGGGLPEIVTDAISDARHFFDKEMR
ncbi:MAG: hypothetical protein II329_01025 [Clostridia bacterium]|nr:hypothetical protein [Clostridia bacterium]